jgi:hypothetical protein
MIKLLQGGRFRAILPPGYLKFVALFLALALGFPACYGGAAKPDFRVVHLRGTHYEMGKQHGTILKNEIKGLYYRLTLFCPT